MVGLFWSDSGVKKVPEKATRWVGAVENMWIGPWGFLGHDTRKRPQVTPRGLCVIHSQCCNGLLPFSGL